MIQLNIKLILDKPMFHEGKIMNYYNLMKKIPSHYSKSLLKQKQHRIDLQKQLFVNFGVSLRHLNDTENTEKPTDEVIPKTNPISEVSEVFPIAIIPIPTDAIIIDTQTFKEIFFS